MTRGPSTTEAFLRFEESIDIGAATYERLLEGINVAMSLIRGAFPPRIVPPAEAPPGNIAVIMGARAPRSFDLELVELFVMGSYARRTLVPTETFPIFDVDIAAVFQADSPYDVYTSFGPEQLLREVADVLRKLKRPVAMWAGEAITIDFGAINIDVWPAMRLWNNTTFQFPKHGTMWFRSNPRTLDERFADLDEAMGGKLSAVARCMKVWNIRKWPAPVLVPP